MDTTTLISNTIDAVAWPIGVVAIIAMLRPALIDRLGHLRSLKFGQLEAEFSQELARAREIAEQANLVGVPLDAGLTERESDKYLQLASISPRSAVIEAWGKLEEEARTRVEAQRPRGSDTPLTAASLGDTLAKLGVLGPESLQAFTLLRSLRNQAVHEPQQEITTDEAVEYGNLTRGLADSLRGSDART